MPSSKDQMDQILHCLADQKIGNYTTEVRFFPKQRVGHFDFSLFLKNTKNLSSEYPLIKGIFSKGNASQNIQAWFDIHYSDVAVFTGEEPVTLSRCSSLAEQTFQTIGKALPPGGMMFVSVITDIAWDIASMLHRVTRQCLSMRTLSIPPVATPLGRLLFISGCRSIKSQAFDVQGSSRLAGEKAPNPEVERQFSQKIQTQIHNYFLQKDQKKFTGLHRAARSNAKDVLKRLSIP
ncbi:MAG: hypothetical protein JXB23_07285, partial [Candidatus Aminicenantes bacterium]|nr:hypothetical protein [Candidatus Aminicenantes bacterium]